MQLKPIKKEHLLAELDDILRHTPSRDAFDRHDEETIPWIGRAAAAIERWDVAHTAGCLSAVMNLQSLDMHRNAQGVTEITTLLHQARSDLQMDVGPLNTV